MYLSMNMKKPEELIELLETLKMEISRPSARYDSGARVMIYIGKGEMNLAAKEAIFFLHSADTVNRFFEALGSPNDTGIELYSFEIDDDAKSALDSNFSTVDEM